MNIKWKSMNDDKTTEPCSSQYWKRRGFFELRKKLVQFVSVNRHWRMERMIWGVMAVGGLNYVLACFSKYLLKLNEKPTVCFRAYLHHLPNNLLPIKPKTLLCLSWFSLADSLRRKFDDLVAFIEPTQFEFTHRIHFWSRPILAHPEWLAI